MDLKEVINELEYIQDSIFVLDPFTREFKLKTNKERRQYEAIKLAIRLISNYENAVNELENELNDPMSTSESGGVNEYRVGIRYALKILSRYKDNTDSDSKDMMTEYSVLDLSKDHVFLPSLSEARKPVPYENIYPKGQYKCPICGVSVTECRYESIGKGCSYKTKVIKLKRCIECGQLIDWSAVQ